MNIIYTGLFVSSELRPLLLDAKGQYEVKYAHHLTLAFRPTKLDELMVGQRFIGEITDVVVTDKVIVALVNLPEDIECGNKYPHITLSTIKGVPPKDSNSEIESVVTKKGWKSRNLKLRIKLSYGYFDGKEVVL